LIIDIENRTKNETVKMLKGPTKYEDTKKTDKAVLDLTGTKMEQTQVKDETSQTNASLTKLCDGGKSKQKPTTQL